MATSKNKNASNGRRKRGAKPVIGHDPLAPAGEALPDEVENAGPEPAEAVAEEPRAAAEESGAVGAGAADLVFGDSLIIADVADWHQRLSDALKGDGALMLDGGDLEQVDGAGLQLLAAFMKEAVTLHLTVEWSAASQVLCEAADQSGLAGLLRLNEVNEAA
ncbi:MAG TPA: STAS domain-containing protein [Sedimenticola sp.]|nr:STAS domain-containing protein [Sedimenticola sp.]